MHLLHAEENGHYSLLEYVGDRIPPYAILSHTWGHDHEEVTFKDVTDRTGMHKAGYRKLAFCRDQAAKDGLQFFWVDTCCIDKSSSAELSEAINSMFRWYKEAARCYVYLADVSLVEPAEEDNSKRWKPAFRKSHWFTRGWTLQELIAPPIVEFFCREGTRLGDKKSLEQTLHEITGIAMHALRGYPVSQFGFEERMLWAEQRQTKRGEDAAYSLLGIFDVHMPLIYGEGRQKAMIRLQREIRQSSRDRLPMASPPLSIQPSGRKPYSTVPFNQDFDFVHRPEILSWVREQCEAPATRFALVGIGGVGKSQLAIQFCHNVHAESPSTWVFWVHVGTRARFEDGYRRIADAVKMEGWDNPQTDPLRLVRSWLCDESNGRWVMVIDNADDSDLLFPTPHEEAQAARTGNPGQITDPLSEFLPQSPNGSILITSRNQDVAYKLTGSHTRILEVEPMNENDALALLFKKLSCSDADRSDAIGLVRALDYMPLAITQAAAYIEQRAPRMTISRYLDEVTRDDHNRAHLLTKDVGDSRRDGRASNSIITTWQISFEYIRTHRPTAARLLSLMSLFDRQGIPELLLRNRYQNDDAAADFEEDIHTLTSYSLVRITGDVSEFEMHRLVQFSTKKWLELHDEFEKWKQIYLVIVDKALPDGSYENWTTCQKLFPHAEMVQGYQPTQIEYIEQWGSILYKAAWYAAKKGHYKKAEEIDRLTLELREKTLGKDHPSTLRSVDNLARVLRKQRRYSEAEAMHRRALEGETKALGAEHPDTLISMSCLGLVLTKQGKYEEAEALLRQAIEIDVRVDGCDHRNTLTNLGLLASVLSAQGKYRAAEAMHRRDLAASEKTLGPGHPDTLISVGNVGSVLLKQGKYKEATVMSWRALKGNEKVLGPEHPLTLVSISNFGLLLAAQGRYSEAEKMYRRDVQGCKKVLGEDHPDTVFAMDQLRTVLRYQGKDQEAEAVA